MATPETERSLTTMPLQAFMDPSEWLIFQEEIANVASNFPDINGVLAIGSLVQSFRPPSNFYEARRKGALGLAYESIRNPERRKIFPSNSSDLDLWVSVRDTPDSAAAEEKASLGGIALLQELATGATLRGTRRWSNKKAAAFGGYYKQGNLYPSSFAAANDQDEPWMAARFKALLEDALLRHAPDFVDRIARFTEKKIPGNFLEVRAFPESLYNLRPDDQLLMDGVRDAQPFPRIADDQWISPLHTSAILYATDEIDIYPFRQNGRILGKDIDDHIRNHEPTPEDRSLGALLLKPDALQAGEIGRIKEIILRGVAVFGGKIVCEKLFDPMTPAQVAEIYPTLSGQDLIDATAYIGSGKSLGIVIEGNVPQPQMVQIMGIIKGPRLADRNEERLLEGRITDGSIRDLLPLPGDEEVYRQLLPTIFQRKNDPSHTFTAEQYAYYSRNLVHSPDNDLELAGLLRVIGCDIQ